jgi:uncharacterized phage-like protein YoqJ
MKIAFTGHRPDSTGMGGYNPYSPQQQWVRRQVRAALERAMQKHPVVEVHQGLALGFDTWVAQEALSLGLPLFSYQPMLNQSGHWRSDSQATWEHLVKQSVRHIKCWDELPPVAFTRGNFVWNAMQFRNEMMLEAADVLIACWNGNKKGGTYNCLRTAQSGKSMVPGTDFQSLKKEYIYHINPVTKTAGWME